MSDFLSSPVLSYVPLALAALVLLAAAIKDIRSFKISNWLSLALAALFPVYALVAHIPLWPHLLVGLVVFTVGFMLFALGLLGGGDVKLMAAAALWAGPHFAGLFLLSTTTFGGLLAGGYALAALWRSRRNYKTTQTQSDGLANTAVIPWQKAPVPYGMAIACGGWMVLFLMARGPLA